MGLAAQAKQSDRERSEQQVKDAKDRREREIAKLRDHLANWRAYEYPDKRTVGDEFEIEFLGVNDEPLPEIATGDFNPQRGQVVWSHHTVYRFRVDDVIVRMWEHFRTGTIIEPEVDCQQCGRKTSPRECDAHVPYAGNLTEAIGYGLRRRWTCRHCTVSVPETCPTCGRGNR